MNEIHTRRQVTMTYEEAYEMMSRKIPLALRLRSVYVPMMLQDICMMLAKAIRDCVVENAKERATKYMPNVKDKQLKRDMRSLKELTERYERELSHDIGDPRIMKILKDDSMELYGEIVGLIGSMRQSFKNEIWSDGCQRDANTVELIALCYTVRMILEYSIEEDVTTERMMNEYLKEDGFVFTKVMPTWLAELDRAMMAITCTYYEMPKELNSDSINICRMILKKKIDDIDFERYAEDTLEDMKNEGI